MTTQTVGQAVEQRQENSAEAFVRAHERRFSTVLPAHIETETFVGLAVGALHRNPELAKVARSNRGSFLNALLDCARLGHEPGTEAYYLVPFGGRNPEVVGIEGYRGQIERMYRAGAVATITAELVYENDVFDFELGVHDKPRHRVAWFGASADRGKLIGAYAYAVMRDGAVSKVVVMGQHEIEQHRKASRGADSKLSPWNTWPESMWLKTVVRQLEKWVPTSAEYRREQLRAAMDAQRGRDPEPAVEQTEVGSVDPSSGEVLDAELVNDEQTETDEAGGKS